MFETIFILTVSVIIALFIVLRIFALATKEKKPKAHKGKRCPSCKTIIDHRRKVCQYCGYKFE